MGAKANRSGVRIMHEEALFARIRGTQDRIADAITAFAGTMQFVYLHGLWFAVWIVCNEGVFGDGQHLDVGKALLHDVFGELGGQLAVGQARSP